jgi:hypothetical protein
MRIHTDWNSKLTALMENHVSLSAFNHMFNYAKTYFMQFWNWSLVGDILLVTSAPKKYHQNNDKY